MNINKTNHKQINTNHSTPSVSCILSLSRRQSPQVNPLSVHRYQDYGKTYVHLSSTLYNFGDKRIVVVLGVILNPEGEVVINEVVGVVVLGVVKGEKVVPDEIVEIVLFTCLTDEMIEYC
ncbi:uncharacterized protein OCT59_006426 [Rhizophagus irregularis]|uniref:Uncharacterized protein n=2 Tax=Rhizophagus irregularis TaxID=588596 RepID=A0A015KH63_RHIIW|nr:hypothetical protein RirG_120190 [Rhizophagus irregularis DAOM 197198w]UZO14987.1 hypothetical protein OCT59_006426 [Rhizophagus irregularis]GBC18372.1 hypothetical protein RIR_jg1834.t1 [Rhizophagus irregularis DAOM 181602=DAOM 197198]